MNQDDLIRDIHERFRQSGQERNELQRRIWAAREAIRIGTGGIGLVSKALRMSPNTIKRGIREIAAGGVDLHSTSTPRIRRPGGGRKPKTEAHKHSAEADGDRECAKPRSED